MQLTVVDPGFIGFILVDTLTMATFCLTNTAQAEIALRIRVVRVNLDN
jgi:hypothetical protein